ncbi:MAG: hypothetical protein JW771_04480 [Candidatus Thermoplasmatota archaeon]|nr:hypothetical protein [Candidatus Thermoplasmatota archaeon]
MDIDWLLALGSNMYFFLLVYPVLGAGLKYIDDAFDEQTFDKTKALILAPVIGILGALSMLINPISATILLAVVIGVFLKGKVDNRAHLFAFFTFFIIFVLSGIVQVIYLPLIFLSAAAILDEVGNDVIDYNMTYHRRKKFRYKFSLYFFGRRYLMKVALLFVVLMGVFPLYFLIAFILFDEAYIVVSLYSESIKETAKNKSEKA